MTSASSKFSGGSVGISGFTHKGLPVALSQFQKGSGSGNNINFSANNANTSNIFVSFRLSVSRKVIHNFAGRVHNNRNKPISASSAAPDFEKYPPKMPP